MAALLRLPTQKRVNTALIRKASSDISKDGENAGKVLEQIDVRKLNRFNRERLVSDALATNEQDNYKLLSAIKERFNKVGLDVPSIEVRYRNLTIGADVQLGSRALPTLINYTRDVFEDDVAVRTPGSGKTTLLLALAGKLDSNLKKSGSITYNGHEQSEFCIQRASAYTAQTDNHIAELTVRETFDFANRCQGSSDAEILKNLERLEKEKNIMPSPEIDAFMKASLVGGKRHNVMTDYVLKDIHIEQNRETNTIQEFESMFFRYMLLLLMLHQMALGLFRFMAALARDMVIANTFGSAALMVIFLLGGFIIPKAMIKPWWIWGYWLSPLTYGQRAISVNEFTATRWMQHSAFGGDTVGHNVLNGYNIPSDDYWYWIGFGVLTLYTIIFNCLITWGLSYLNPLQKARSILLGNEEDSQTSSDKNGSKSSGDEGQASGMILPFEPMTMTFHGVNYYVNMPQEIAKQGVGETRLKLLSNLLLMKRGGRVIYGGKIGRQSDVMIKYFQGVLSSIKEYGQPPPGSQPLKFDTIYSQNTMAQFLKCLWKQNLVYWRSPPYNAMRIFFTIICALIFGTVFWNIGTKRGTTHEVYGLVEIPYVALQTIIFGVITYYMVNFERDAVSWTLRGIITSQLGDVEEMLEGPGFQGTVKEFIAVTLGYDQTINGMSSVLLSVIVLICFNILFFGCFAVSIKVLNFQKR
ncbi:hypothetical protein ACSQ67_011878 [Phaseolus vulgaris]